MEPVIGQLLGVASRGSVSTKSVSIVKLRHEGLVLTIKFGGKPITRSEANWSGLLNTAVREARAKAMASEVRSQ